MAKKINTIIGIIIMVCLIPFSGKIKTAANNTLTVVLETDSPSYTAGDEVDMCINLTQYGEDFDGNVTTMIVEVTYDSSKLVLDNASVKKLADDNDGFSHVSIADGLLTYQYLNVKDPLEKGDTALFSCIFKSTEQINDIGSVLTISEAIMQDGQQKESVRFPVSTAVSTGESAEQVVSDKGTGQYLYNEQGEYILAEQQTEASKENSNDSSNKILAKGSKTSSNADSAVGQNVSSNAESAGNENVSSNTGSAGNENMSSNSDSEGGSKASSNAESAGDESVSLAADSEGSQKEASNADLGESSGKDTSQAGVEGDVKNVELQNQTGEVEKNSSKIWIFPVAAAVVIAAVVLYLRKKHL